MGDEAKRPDTMAAQPKPLLKFLIELGPLVAFFVAWSFAGMFWATGVLMAATVVSAVASKALLGHIPFSLTMTAVLVLFFGALTFWFEDTDFIKMKPTIIYLLFAGVLAAGLYLKRPLIKLLLGEAFKLTEEGWRKLTIRWIGFFITMAVANEIIRHVSEPLWVNFKLFGVLPLTLVFAMAQIGLIRRYEAKTEAETEVKTEAKTEAKTPA
jgi:intracellular septation protein